MVGQVEREESICNRKNMQNAWSNMVELEKLQCEQYVFDLPAILDAQNLQKLLYDHLCAKFANLTWLLPCPSRPWKTQFLWSSSRSGNSCSRRRSSCCGVSSSRTALASREGCAGRTSSGFPWQYSSQINTEVSQIDTEVSQIKQGSVKKRGSDKYKSQTITAVRQTRRDKHISLFSYLT